MYIYPDNLSAKATLWLWELRDIGIIGVGLLLSVLALTQTGIALPLVLTAVFAFLTIRHEGTSILDFIRYAAAFLLTKQQYYEWRLDPLVENRKRKMPVSSPPGSSWALMKLPTMASPPAWGSWCSLPSSPPISPFCRTPAWAQGSMPCSM